MQLVGCLLEQLAAVGKNKDATAIADRVLSDAGHDDCLAGARCLNEERCAVSRFPALLDCGYGLLLVRTQVESHSLEAPILRGLCLLEGLVDHALQCR